MTTKRTGKNNCNRRFHSGMTTNGTCNGNATTELAIGMWLLLAEEAEFAGGAVGAEIVREMECGSGAGGYGGVGAEAAEAEEA